MLTKIAWRNVWRSRGRSLTIILAITIGVASVAFLIGFMNAFIISFVESGINNDYSHIQIHNPKFAADKELKFSIQNADQITGSLNANDTVKAVSSRIIVNGMVSSPTGASGIALYGVNAEHEARVTGLDSSIVEGGYLGTISRNPILISAKLAEKLKLKVRSKLVLTFQNINGDITAGSFRVAGIFESPSKKVNSTVAYVQATDLNRLTGHEGIHEIAILLNSIEDVPAFSEKLAMENSNLKVEPWNVLAPELELIQSQVWINLLVVLVIIMGALCFGIVNTMLMAVLERVRELGMLMAVGMEKRRVFKMIILETLMMAAVGAPLGILLGLATNGYFMVNGLDLSNYAEGLKEFGYATILYPSVSASDYLLIAASISITAIIAAIYPARKAIKLKPVEALHKI